MYNLVSVSVDAIERNLFSSMLVRVVFPSLQRRVAFPSMLVGVVFPPVGRVYLLSLLARVVFPSSQMTSVFTWYLFINLQDQYPLSSVCVISESENEYALHSVRECVFVRVSVPSNPFVRQ